MFDIDMYSTQWSIQNVPLKTNMRYALSNRQVDKNRKLGGRDQAHLKRGIKIHEEFTWWISIIDEIRPALLDNSIKCEHRCCKIPGNEVNQKKIEKKNEKKYSDTKNVLVFKDRGYEATVVRKQYW